MTVEKFIVTKEDCGYTTLPNLVLQQFADLEALGLWCYFQSKPPAWNFNKKDIRSIFKIGIHKLENILNILKNHNLIEIIHERNTRGCFSTWYLHVKNGSEFNPLSKNCRTVKTSRKHRSPENRATDNRATVISTYKRKNIENQDKEKKDKSFCETKEQKENNKKKHDWAPMKNERAEIEKSEKTKKSKMPDYLHQQTEALKKSILRGSTRS